MIAIVVIGNNHYIDHYIGKDIVKAYNIYTICQDLFPNNTVLALHDTADSIIKWEQYVKQKNKPKNNRSKPKRVQSNIKRTIKS